MKSPLQAAHDQAGAETIICTVAAPRQVAMVGVYTGVELQSRSSRPGAYDAMRLPSLVNGRQRIPGTPAEQPTAYVPPAPSPITARARVVISDAAHALKPFVTHSPVPAKAGKKHRDRPEPRTSGYAPRPGSVPDRVIQALRELPPSTSFSAREIEEKFGLPRAQFYGSFQLPIAKGALLFFRRASGKRERVVALPGWPTGDAENAHQPADDVPATTHNVVFASGHVDAIPDSETGNRRFWPIHMSGLTSLSDEEAHGLRAFLHTASEAFRPSSQSGENDDTVADAEEASAQYELNLRETEHALLTRYIAVLQLRRQVFDAVRLFPLPPLTEPPRLTDAA